MSGQNELHPNIIRNFKYIYKLHLGEVCTLPDDIIARIYQEYHMVECDAGYTNDTYKNIIRKKLLGIANLYDRMVIAEMHDAMHPDQ